MGSTPSTARNSAPLRMALRIASRQRVPGEGDFYPTTVPRPFKRFGRSREFACVLANIRKEDVTGHRLRILSCGAWIPRTPRPPNVRRLRCGGLQVASTTRRTGCRDERDVGWSEKQPATRDTDSFPHTPLYEATADTRESTGDEETEETGDTGFPPTPRARPPRSGADDFSRTSSRRLFAASFI
jgi:hypothetical protein